MTMHQRPLRKTAPRVTATKQAPMAQVAGGKISARQIDQRYRDALTGYRDFQLKIMHSTNDATYVGCTKSLEAITTLAMQSGQYKLVAKACLLLDELRKDMTTANHEDMLAGFFAEKQQLLQNSLLQSLADNPSPAAKNAIGNLYQIVLLSNENTANYLKNPGDLSQVAYEFTKATGFKP